VLEKALAKWKARNAPAPQAVSDKPAEVRP